MDQPIGPQPLCCGPTLFFPVPVPLSSCPCHYRATTGRRPAATPPPSAAPFYELVAGPPSSSPRRRHHRISHGACPCHRPAAASPPAASVAGPLLSEAPPEATGRAIQSSSPPLPMLDARTLLPPAYRRHHRRPPPIPSKQPVTYMTPPEAAARRAASSSSTNHHDGLHSSSSPLSPLLPLREATTVLPLLPQAAVHRRPFSTITSMPRSHLHPLTCHLHGCRLQAPLPPALFPSLLPSSSPSCLLHASQPYRPLCHLPETSHGRYPSLPPLLYCSKKPMP